MELEQGVLVNVTVTIEPGDGSKATIEATDVGSDELDMLFDRLKERMPRLFAGWAE